MYLKSAEKEVKRSPDRAGILLLFAYFQVPRPGSFILFLVELFSPLYQEHFEIIKKPMKKGRQLMVNILKPLKEWSAIRTQTKKTQSCHLANFGGRFKPNKFSLRNEKPNQCKRRWLTVINERRYLGTAIVVINRIFVRNHQTWGKS